jgi:integrase
VLALEFRILTAARSGKVLGARWSEIDLKNKIWTVPANRMKAGREHRVRALTQKFRIRDHRELGLGILLACCVSLPD